MKKECLKFTIVFLFSLTIFIRYFFTNKNGTILSEYIKEQKQFCKNIKKYFNKSVEEKLELLEIKLNKLEYKMYVPHKNKNHSYKKNHCFEKNESINFIKALKYYSKRLRITNNKEIFMLDIGGNIGWYPFLLGRYGYTIITFEPEYNNYYVIRKNICTLKQKSNVIIVTKGLNNEEKICDYYVDSMADTNGMTLCRNNNNERIISQRFIKKNSVILTRISNFIPYLSKKNIALIKMDIEGSEGIVIENGIDLVTKYHVPFIFIEFTPKLLLEHKTDPRKFIQKFLNNGYKIIKNKRNKGTFVTRNIGVLFSKGKYIILPDPDDCLSKNMLKSFYSIAEKYNYEMIKFNIFYTSNKKLVLERFLKKLENKKVFQPELSTYIFYGLMNY
jgi:FkbM family methyltransferase